MFFMFWIPQALSLKLGHSWKENGVVLVYFCTGHNFVKNSLIYMTVTLLSILYSINAVLSLHQFREKLKENV